MKNFHRLGILVATSYLAFAYRNSPTASAATLSNFNVKDAGITISYPAGWKVQEHPDKDTLVKFSGTSDDGTSGELTVNATKQFGVSLDTFAQMLKDALATKLPSYRLVKQSAISIGKQKNLSALCREASFTAGTMPIKQRYVVFACSDNFVSVSMIAPANQSDKLSSLSDQVFNSITSNGGKQVEANRFESANKVNQFTDYTNNKVSVSFSYPKGWTTEEVDDREHPAKIVGQYPDGSIVEISLYCGDLHPYLTMEQMLQELEKRYYADRKDYRLIRQEPATFGSGTTIQGVSEEVSFDHNGMNVKQCFVCFPWKEKLYLLSVLSPNLKDSELQALYQKIIATIRLTE